MKLDVGNWKYVLLNDICKITMGNKMDASAMTSNNPEVNFVGRSADNNGVAGKVDIVYDNKGKMIKPYPAGCVTVALGGSLGSTFLQKEPFYTSQNVSVLEFPEGVSDEAKLFLCTLIYNESKYKYFPFGRELNTHIRVDYGFTVPVLSDGTPNWRFMDDYIKSLHHKPLTTKNRVGQGFDLGIRNWSSFRLNELFRVELSKGDIKFDDMGDGPIPLVSSGETNNGIVGYIDENGDGKAEIFPANLITVDMFGNAFYQEKPFYAVSHGRVNILNPKFKLTKSIGLFLSTVIKQEQYKYSYGRAVYSGVVEEMEIKLPISPDRQPDWQFMEEYIKALPYGDRL